MRTRSSRILVSVLRHGVLVALAAGMLFPFLWMLSTAVKTDRETAEIPPRLLPAASAVLPDGASVSRLDVAKQNFATAWRGAPFGRYLFNTLIVAFAVTAGVIVTSVLAGYAFACIRFPGRRLLFILILATLMIPFEVTLLPNFLTVSRMKAALGVGALRTWWLPEYLGLILPWAAGAFSVFLMRQHFASIPTDYFDAARIDGCGHLRFLRHVGVPLAAPAIATVAIFAFLGSWNAFTWPLLVTDDQRFYVVQIGLRSFLDMEAARYNFMMAASTIVLAPMLVLYFCAQRFLVEGVTTGGIKE